MLGAVGTYLFASVPVSIIFGLPKFAPAVDTLRAFAPLLLVMYVNLYLSNVVLAAGRASRLAASKVAAVVVVVGLSFCPGSFLSGALRQRQPGSVFTRCWRANC